MEALPEKEKMASRRSSPRLAFALGQRWLSRASASRASSGAPTKATPARAVGIQFARPSHILGGDHRLAQGFPLNPQPRGIIAQFQHHRRLPLCHIAGQIHHVGQGFAPSGLIPQNLGWQGLTRAAPQALVTVKLFQPLLQRTGCDFL
jgi:hypothetical protein